MDLLQRKLYFSKDPEGGVQMLISIVIHTTLDYLAESFL